MPDREKVIKGLEICTSRPCYCTDCPYKANCCLDSQEVMEDALALLKEQEDALEQMRLDNTDLRNCNAELMKAQEAKQVIKQTYHVMMNRDYDNPVVVIRYDWLCPTCKSLLCRDIDAIDDNYHFCKVCGQAVKWE